jgi:hypothetical protein
MARLEAVRVVLDRSEVGADGLCTMVTNSSARLSHSPWHTASVVLKQELRWRRRNELETQTRKRTDEGMQLSEVRDRPPVSSNVVSTFPIRRSWKREQQNSHQPTTRNRQQNRCPNHDLILPLRYADEATESDADGDEEDEEDGTAAHG